MTRISTRATTLAALLCPIISMAAHAADAPTTTLPAPTTPPAERGSTLPTPGTVPTVPETAPQTPPTTSEAAPEAAPEVDAAAETLLSQASAAYKSLSSLSELIEVKANIPGEKPQVRRIRVYFQRPNKALVRVTDIEGTSTLAADGKNFSMMVPQVKGQYMQRTLPEPTRPVDVAMSRTAGAGPGLDLWLSGGDILSQVRPLMSSLKLGTSEQIGGVDTESAVLTLKGRTGPATLTFSFGKADHLLRRLVLERSAQGPDGKVEKLSVVENHSEVQKGQPIAASLLKFLPPSGYKKVESLEPPTYDEKLKVGLAPYAFNAKDLSGKTLTLDQYKGKVVLLDFWATWCVPCMMEMPDVQAAYKKYKAQGFDIIGVSSDESKNDLQTVIKQRGLGWRMIFDGAEGPVNAKYKVVAIPTSFLIGRDGKIAAINLRGPELEPAIKKALAPKTAASKTMSAKSAKSKR